MRKIVIAAALACAAGLAQAADGFYAGAGITRAQVNEIFGPGSDLKIDNTSWKALMGFKFPLVPVGVEAEYDDFGSESHNFGFVQGQANAKAFGAFAVGWLPVPVPNLDVFGKLGLARVQLNGSTTSPSLFQLNSTDTQFAWGVGTQLHIQNVAVRVEYEGINVPNTSGARLFSVGASYY